MSLFGKIVTKAIVKKAGEIALVGAANLLNNTESIDSFSTKSAENYTLLIKRKGSSKKRKFTVIDELDEKKYIIKTDYFSFGYSCIRLYDTAENEIGKVELSSKFGTKVYNISLDNKIIATLSCKGSFIPKYELNFNNWKLEYITSHNSYLIKNKEENQIAKFSTVSGERDSYTIELIAKENEIIGLLLLMAIEVHLHGND